MWGDLGELVTFLVMCGQKKGILGQKWVLVAELGTWTTDRMLVVLFVLNSNFLTRAKDINKVKSRCDEALRSLNTLMVKHNK